MTENIVPITKEEHQNLKIKTEGGIEHVENVHVAPVVVTEFSDVAANCPIIFVKDEQGGRFRPAAMMGLQAEENLFYAKDGQWEGTHIPMNLGRAPFSIKSIGEGKMGAAIDLDSDLVGEEDGEPLFDENGKETEYFMRVNSFLSQLFEGEVLAQRMTDALVEHNVLREFRLLVEDVEGKTRELTGLWTPVAGLLQELPDEAILKLNKEGFLAATHVIIQSMAQIKRLVKQHNLREGVTQIRSINVDMLNQAPAGNEGTGG